jgi:hypothetical protein
MMFVRAVCCFIVSRVCHQVRFSRCDRSSRRPRLSRASSSGCRPRGRPSTRCRGGPTLRIRRSSGCPPRLRHRRRYRRCRRLRLCRRLRFRWRRAARAAPEADLFRVPSPTHLIDLVYTIPNHNNICVVYTPINTTSILCDLTSTHSGHVSSNW